MKYCSKCHQRKPYAEFYRNTRGWDGYRPDCRECHNEVARDWYMRDRNSQKKAVPRTTG